MKIRAMICSDTDEPWPEIYDTEKFNSSVSENPIKTLEEATEVMKETVAYFNRTLRKGEKARTLISVEEISEGEYDSIINKHTKSKELDFVYDY